MHKIDIRYYCKMVYYVVACFQENSSEKQVETVIDNQVLKEGSRKLGDLISLTDGVRRVANY